ncbi:putative sugar-binding periplasmic abc transporter protein [Oceanicola granulosus HTCC2516]|uniref:Putative sugar-binding periplasmic abc transporter protein n=1 Tax=Oceanicola granulosus (strain ATCC BAA-861 / DSM 15982 / KCTC 12143 / HTCC2516) TaxID=314256 RepID=Q2CE12_OCEGH|nr:sugar ABC transporter substrate-binding protein [Oceanicola granulosus]EAR50926.1 putative sugar-binding periplasmic abc transporter protein [Oceanicola granulosus HTCC2516]
MKLHRLIAGTSLLALGAGMAGAEELTLVEVITSPERTEVLESLVGAWEEESGHSVEIVSLPWGQAFETLATMVAGGDIPDVVEMPERWMALYTGADQLVDLGPMVAAWEDGETLTDQTVNMGSMTASGELNMIPYGFYLRAMFYNKDLLAEAGVESPPETMEEFVAAAEAVSALDGKSGYCLRGGPGGTNGWLMFAATMNDSDRFFTDAGQSTITEPGSVEGLQMMIDLYQSGGAPRDSVNWGFNEIVAGFYSGTCAFLDQDPDALIGIADRMDPESFAVMPMPTGPGGHAFPTIGYAGWSIFKATEHPDAAFDLVAHLSSPESNSTWAQRVGVIPIHEGADQDPYFQTEQFAGWFDTLNDPDTYRPLIVPSYLEGYGYFADSLSIETAQQALLGEITAEQLANIWGDFLTEEYAKYQAAGGQ